MVIDARCKPDSGKRTVGQDPGRWLGWLVVDKDDIRQVLGATRAGGFASEFVLSVTGRKSAQGQCVICDRPLLARTYE